MEYTDFLRYLILTIIILVFIISFIALIICSCESIDKFYKNSKITQDKKVHITLLWISLVILIVGFTIFGFMFNHLIEIIETKDTSTHLSFSNVSLHGIKEDGGGNTMIVPEANQYDSMGTSGFSRF